jgi:hypothetical protein
MPDRAMGLLLESETGYEAWMLRSKLAEECTEVNMESQKDFGDSADFRGEPVII